MKPESLIFKPAYTIRTRLVIYLLPILFFGMLSKAAFSSTIFPIIYWLATLAIGLVTSLVPFYIIREVRFPDEMVIRRHFLPDRFFTHTEFEQITVDSIIAGGHHLRVSEITNINQLKKMSERWKASKLLKDNAHKKSSNNFVYPQRGYGTYASFWGLMFGTIVMLINPIWVEIDPRWVMGGTFLLVYLAYIYILPRFFKF